MKWKAKDVQMGPLIRFEPFVLNSTGCDLEGLSGWGGKGAGKWGIHCGHMMHVT